MPTLRTTRPQTANKNDYQNLPRNQNEAANFFFTWWDSVISTRMRLVGLCHLGVYFCRLRLIKRNTGRRPVRLKWYKNQQQLRHSGATARIWPISSDTTGQVYVAATARVLPNQPHEQPRRTKRYMWASLAWPGVAVRLNASWIAAARASRSLNRRSARSRASAPPWPPCAPPCRLRANFHCASRPKGLCAAAPRRQKRCKPLQDDASLR